MNKRVKVLASIVSLVLVLIMAVQGKEVSAATQTEEELVITNHVAIVINKTPVQFKDPILNKAGYLLLPMREFYETIGATVSWNQTTRTASAIRMDKRLDLKIHSLIGVVDGRPVLMDVPAMIHNEKTYVPLRFVSENLDGKVNWDQAEQKVEIDLDEPIKNDPPPSHRFHSDFLGTSFGLTAIPLPVPEARLEGNRSLLVSDNPESLTPASIPSDNVTLSEHEFESSTSKNEHRVFGWHLNKLGQKVTIGITIENNSKSHALNVTSSKGVSKINGTRQIIYDVGLPIADALLNDQLKPSTRDGIRIRPGETETIEAYALDQGELIGFLQDFDITTSGSSSDYTIRTVLSKNKGNLNQIHSHPVQVDSDRKHPRGAWPHSMIVADLPSYTVGSPEVGYNLSNGFTDNLLTGNNSLSKINGAVGNPGHYGMTYQVNIPVENPTGEAKTLKLKLAGRGGAYSGAVKWNEGVYLIPIHPSGMEYVELPDYLLTAETDVISLEIMHAGGSYLPLAIYIEAE